MNISNSKILVIGGAGFIGSFVVSELLKKSVGSVVIYDNFARGKQSNITEALQILVVKFIQMVVMFETLIL